MRVENIHQFSLTTKKHKTNSVNKTNNYQAFVPACDLRFSKLTKEQFIASSNISFLGVERAPENFVLKKAYGLDCPCCGRQMLTKKQVQAFITKIGSRKGVDLRKQLQKGYRFYRPNEEEIANILIEDSEKNPNMDISALVKLEGAKGISRLEAKQKEILRKLLLEAENLSPEKKAEVQNVVDKALRLIDDSNDEGFFQRKSFLKEIDTLMDGKQDDLETLNNINDIAKTMPNSLTSKDAFFVKYSRRENKDIAQRLCTPAMITTEHIQPQSENGKNNTDNYIPLCGDCNSKRGSKSYNEWFLEHPEMPENLQTYINVIYDRIKKGELDDCQDIDINYLEEVIEAVRKATSGELVLKIPKQPSSELITEEEPAEDVSRAVLTPEEQREKWLDTYNALLVEIDDYKSIFVKLKDDEEFLNIKEYTAISEKLKAAARSKNEAKKAFSSAKKNEGHAFKNLDTIQKDKKRAGELSKAKAKAQQAKHAASKAEAAYKTAIAKYNTIKSSYDEIRVKISTPDELNSHICEIKRYMEEYTSLRLNADKLKRKLCLEDEIIIQLSRLNVKIASLEKEAELLSEKHNFNSQEGTASSREYIKSNSQTHNVDDVGNNPIKPDFISESLENAVQIRFDSIEQNERHYFIQDELKCLNGQKNELNDELNQIAESKKSLKQIQRSLRKFRGEMSCDSLQIKLEELIKRKSEVDFKFANADIEDKIKRTTEEANYILQKYCESFKNY